MTNAECSMPNAQCRMKDRDEDSQYRTDWLWLHGAHPFECVPAGAAFLRSASTPCAEGCRRAECRTGEEIRRELGIRVAHHRLARTREPEGHRPHRHRQ